MELRWQVRSAVVARDLPRLHYLMAAVATPGARWPQDGSASLPSTPTSSSTTTTTNTTTTTTTTTSTSTSTSTSTTTNPTAAAVDSLITRRHDLLIPGLTAARGPSALFTFTGTPLMLCAETGTFSVVEVRLFAL